MYLTRWCKLILLWKVELGGVPICRVIYVIVVKCITCMIIYYFHFFVQPTDCNYKILVRLENLHNSSDLIKDCCFRWCEWLKCWKQKNSDITQIGWKHFASLFTLLKSWIFASIPYIHHTTTIQLSWTKRNQNWHPPGFLQYTGCSTLWVCRLSVSRSLFC